MELLVKMNDGMQSKYIFHQQVHTINCHLPALIPAEVIKWL
jgi:hypothetical protein